MDNLYGWIFTYNPLTSHWRACPRENYLRLFSEPETNFLCSSDIKSLQSLIIRTNGDMDLINKLIKQ